MYKRTSYTSQYEINCKSRESSKRCKRCCSVAIILIVVYPKKRRNARFVVDVRKPKNAFKRRAIQFPTVDKNVQKMKGATNFTAIGLQRGYLQLFLHQNHDSLPLFEHLMTVSTKFCNFHGFLFFWEIISWRYSWAYIRYFQTACENISDNM